MTRRTGASTLIRTAQFLCKKIVQFTPAIEAFATDKPAVKAALAAALTACSVLESTLRDEFLVEGD